MSGVGHLRIEAWGGSGAAPVRRPDRVSGVDAVGKKYTRTIRVHHRHVRDVKRGTRHKKFTINDSAGSFISRRHPPNHS